MSVIKIVLKYLHVNIVEGRTFDFFFAILAVEFRTEKIGITFKNKNKENLKEKYFLIRYGFIKVIYMKKFAT